MPSSAAAGALVLDRRRASTSTDAELASRVASGDSEALRTLYEAHHGALRAFARRVLGDEAEAEDLVHDVFVSARRTLAGFEARASLRTFLMSIVVNHIRHRRRATARRIGALEKLHVEPRERALDAEEAGERRRLAARMQRLLDGLPMDQRVAVVLCVVEERTSVEAAEIVGVPEATIRTRVFHARRKMREMLSASAAGTATEEEVVR
jgi:RNA polymerase sigma-70 factor, ECF subfamily